MGGVERSGGAAPVHRRLPAFRQHRGRPVRNRSQGEGRPVSATFKGTVSLVDINPPESYGLELAVNSGAAGFGKGTVAVTLKETPEGTLLSYTGAGTVGGKLAQIGQRLIDVAARKTADRFFETFTGLVRVDEAAPESERTNAGTGSASAGNGRRTRLAWGADWRYCW